MARSLDSKLVYLSPDDLKTEVTAKEAAVRERAFELGRTRTSPRDEIRDWLDAERSLYRRPNVRLALVGSIYRLEVELPGIDPEQISIRLGGDRVILGASRGEGPATSLVDEFGASEWWREQRLPEDARTDRAEIGFENGVLTLVMARAVPAPSSVSETESAAATDSEPVKPTTRAPAGPKSSRVSRSSQKSKKTSKRPKANEA